MGLILGDLQMFRNFAKFLVLNISVHGVSAESKRLDKISKQGNFWVVEEPLEISIY